MVHKRIGAENNQAGRKGNSKSRSTELTRGREAAATREKWTIWALDEGKAKATGRSQRLNTRG